MCICVCMLENSMTFRHVFKYGLRVQILYWADECHIQHWGGLVPVVNFTQ